jgi:hypothetical protein
MNARALRLSHDQAQAIELGARYLATLAAVERAHALDDEQDLEAILAGVDPIEVRLTANVLKSLSFLWHALPPVPTEIRGGTDGASSRVPLSVTAAPSPDGEAEQPSAPVIHLDPYSRKAPCA